MIYYLNSRVLGYEKFTIITLSNVGRVGTERGGSKKFKLIPTPPHGAGLKFMPIPTPSLLWGRKNPSGMK